MEIIQIYAEEHEWRHHQAEGKCGNHFRFPTMHREIPDYLQKIINILFKVQLRKREDLEFVNCRQSLSSSLSCGSLGERHN